MQYEELADSVRACRIQKMYDSEVKRLIFATHDAKARKDMLAALRFMGYKVLTGQAPPGGLEVELQKLLEKKKGKKRRGANYAVPGCRRCRARWRRLPLA